MFLSNKLFLPNRLTSDEEAYIKNRICTQTNATTVSRVWRRWAFFIWVQIITVWLCLSAVMMAQAADTAADKNSPAPAAPQAPAKSDPADDGWPDLSDFVDKVYGFIPVVMPITEPAVGFGAAGALAFIDRPKDKTEDKFARPNITVVGGFLTENETKGLLGGDVRYWQDGRLQTVIGGLRASVNLDFYGVGRDAHEDGTPLSYNLDMSGGMVQAKYRLGQSRFWAGLGYGYAATQVKFSQPAQRPASHEFRQETRIGGLAPSLSYDTRDNVFTTLSGTYLETSVSVFSEALGGDGEFQRVNILGMHFWPLHQKLTFGMRYGAMLSFGDVPFFLRPFVQLRGAPVMRYQGEHEAQIEAELRWQFWRRFSLVGFAGTGVAWNEFQRFDNTTTVVTGGGGFRYELARRYGIHAGLDVAYGQEGAAVYVQVGGAWARP